jgi:hypothetical protein
MPSLQRAIGRLNSRVPGCCPRDSAGFDERNFLARAEEFAHLAEPSRMRRRPGGAGLETRTGCSGRLPKNRSLALV